MREERKRKAKSFLPRFTEFRRSICVKLRTKVHRIDEGYAWVQKIRDFIEDPREEFGKSKVSGLGSFLLLFLSSKRKTILPTLAYFPSLGQENRVFRLRACLVKKN